MKALWIAVGTVWLAGWTICSYRVFASSRSLEAEIESDSPLPPPAQPSPSVSAPMPHRTFTREELLGGPATRPVKLGTPPRSITPPIAPLPLRASSPPRITYPLTATPRPTAERSQPAPETERDGEAALCLTCKEPAHSWVELDGRRYGYCLKHQGQATVNNSAGTDRTVAHAQQCLGVAKSGSQCRRKTSDPSGYCYQHRSR